MSFRAVASSSSWNALHPDHHRIGSLCHSGVNLTTPPQDIPEHPNLYYSFYPLITIINIISPCFVLFSTWPAHYLKLYFLFNFWSPLEGEFFESQGPCLTPHWILKASLKLNEPLTDFIDVWEACVWLLTQAEWGCISASSRNFFWRKKRFQPGIPDKLRQFCHKLNLNWHFIFLNT